METVDAFKKQQERTVKRLQDLLAFLKEGEACGVDIDPKFKEKLNVGIKTAADEKLKVALVGAFSVGKTSLVAAWSEKYDATMKISAQESSDSIELYDIGDFVLVDTPGLFGFKETANKEKYKDITRKHISEAHLVLYLTDPNNPIQESHREELIWLFKELNLLPRTIFVLSGFDKEADIEDDEEFNERLEIKRQNIIGGLKSFGLISGADEDVAIVAVSADPYAKGIDKYWFNHLSEFKKLSRIEMLQEATTNKIEKVGGSTALIEATKNTIVADVLQKHVPRIMEYHEKVGKECDRLRELCDEQGKELRKIDSNLKQTRIELRRFITDLFTDLILQARGLSEETIVDFFERNIGSEGIVLESKIRDVFDLKIDAFSNEISKIQIRLDDGIRQYNDVIGGMAIDGMKAGGKLLASGGVKVSAAGVKAARDILAPAFKFKPWEAVKLAKNLSIALTGIGTAVGIGFELWDTYKQKEKEKEFRDGIENIVKSFEQQRKEYLATINDDEHFIQDSFPGYIVLKQQVEGLYKNLQENELMYEKIKKWKEHGDAIKNDAVEAEFEVVS